ncbi:DUF488 domain-containing protein [Microbispora sp. NPDC046973]|uniref:DUF488 domain-containing protein n=1 Tax=Microbispora sp. NPDC046973 TaxID=3155022 RepID=UPI0033C65327
MGERGGVVGLGYEGLDLDGFVRGVVEMGLETLVDVRLNPISRKPGFSKRRLAEALAGHGISYVHFPQLGNPKWNRAGFGAEGIELAEAMASYAEEISSPEAGEAIDDIVIMAQKGLTGVLCFEASERRCHRQVVLEQVNSRLDLLSAPR